MNSLHDLFYEVMDSYEAAYKKVWSTGSFRHPISALISRDIPCTLGEIINNNPQYLINGSCGTGRWTKVPWVAVFDSRVTTSATKGVYVVYLFNSSEKTLYLTLEVAATETAELAKKLAHENKQRSVKELQKQLLSEKVASIRKTITRYSFEANNDVNSGKEEFDNGVVIYKKYSIDNLPSDSTLVSDFTNMISIYASYCDWMIAGVPIPCAKKIEPVPVIEEETQNREEEPTGDAAQSEYRLHTEAQWLLIQLGRLFGCKAFVARNDRTKKFNGQPLSDFCIEELPHDGLPGTAYKSASLIDVVWVKDDVIKCAFEVEVSTSIYSGILRMSDLNYSIPYDDNIRCYIIAPNRRISHVKEQMERPTFKRIDRTKWQYFSIEDLQGFYESVKHFKPGALNLEALSSISHTVK